MKTVLVLAYQLSPTRGSEYSVGWNFVTKISEYHRVIVLYGASGDHMGEMAEVEDYAAGHPNPRIEFVPVEAGRLANAINRFNKVGLHPVFYFAFRLWQKRALAAARGILARSDVDVVHHLGPIGFREPGYLGKLDKPLVWGPIGGTLNKSGRLMAVLPAKKRIVFTIKNLVNSLQFRLSPRVVHAFRRADALICATTADGERIRAVHGRQAWHLPEGGVFSAHLDEAKFKELHSEIRIVWSGTHDARKNLGMFMRVLTMLRDRNRVRVDILGDGPETAHWKNFAAQNGLDPHVTWHGRVSRDKAIRIMAEAHLHVITSLMEANTTVLFEAMSHGVPTMSLDHCGMRDTICADSGIKISPASYEIAVGGFVDALEAIMAEPDRLKDLAQGTLRCAQKFSWDRKVRSLNRIYEDAIKLHGDRLRNKSGNNTSISGEMGRQS